MCVCFCVYIQPTLLFPLYLQAAIIFEIGWGEVSSRKAGTKQSIISRGQASCVGINRVSCVTIESRSDFLGGNPRNLVFIR